MEEGSSAGAFDVGLCAGEGTMDAVGVEWSGYGGSAALIGG